MKKRFVLLLLAVLCLLALSGCACEHVWEEADCTTPKTCSECSETEGAPLGHSWLAATCSAPKTCENCGETEGEALPHTFADATCSAPQTCSVCGETEGEALPHSFADATCAAPKTCTVCGTTEGEALEHSWVDATYTAPKTCTVCGATEGTALERLGLGVSMDNFAVTVNSALQSMGYQLSYYGVDEDGWPIYDVYTSSGTYTNVFFYLEPCDDGVTALSMLICTEDLSDSAVSLMGSVGAVGVLCVDEEFDTDALVQLLMGSPTMSDGVAYYYMEDRGLTVDIQLLSDYCIFWIYPVE